MVSGMRGYRTAAGVVTVVVAACSSGGTPATTPPPVPSTTTSTPATLPPTTSTTTTVATTTTMNRLAEIEAIFQDLEERRLQALYDGDREAFQALFANTEYMTRSMGAFDVVEFETEPVIDVEVLAVLHESSSCIAVTRVLRRVDTGQTSEETVGVIEGDGDEWGFSYAGEGWACEGPHPFSS